MNRELSRDELRQFLTEREVGNVVRLYRNLRVPGGSPGRLGWLRKEAPDSYAVRAGIHDDESADIDTAVEVLQEIAPYYLEYEGPESEL